MLVFLDESGDSGFKLKKGSSRYFCVALVVFRNLDEASACDKEIDSLRKKLKWLPSFEFHYKNNSNKVRKMFLNSVKKYKFSYYGFILNKDPVKLWGDGFRDKNSFYKYVCSLIFENARPLLDKVTVIIDKSGNQDFRRQLTHYLKTKINTKDKTYIKKVKMQRSSSNNLLQLADYVVGVLRGKVVNKKNAQFLYKMIAKKEVNVQLWPK